MATLGRESRFFEIMYQRHNTLIFNNLEMELSNFFVAFIDVNEDRKGLSLQVEPHITTGDYPHGFLLRTRSGLYESDQQSNHYGSCGDTFSDWVTDRAF